MKRSPLPSLSCFLLILTGLLLLPGNCRSESAMPDRFVDVQEVVPSLQLDIRYYGPHNFVGERIDGYNAPKCLLTKEAAAALATAQQDLEPLALSLKVYDCYRPQRAVDHFARWAKNPGDRRTKMEFYPTLEKRDLMKDAYIGAQSGHSRGSAVDITMVSLPISKPAPFRPGEKLQACYLPPEKRFRDNSLDMGTGFDCFHELSHTADLNVGAKQRINRLLLKKIMGKNGFKNYEKEWWHYTLRNEPFPKTYFDFVIK